MNDATQQRIEARIEQLKQARDQFVNQANRQVAMYDGAIGELEALLKPQPQIEPAAAE